jgi:hypothetical protein
VKTKLKQSTIISTGFVTEATRKNAPKEEKNRNSNEIVP